MPSCRSASCSCNDRQARGVEVTVGALRVRGVLGDARCGSPAPTSGRTPSPGLSVVGGATGDCSMPAASAASMASTKSCRLRVERVDVSLGRRRPRGRPPSARRGASSHGPTARHCCGGVRAAVRGLRVCGERRGLAERVLGTLRRCRRRKACSPSRAITRGLAGAGAPTAPRANHRPVPPRRAGTRPPQRRRPRTLRRATSAALDRRRSRRRRRASSWPRNRSVRGHAPDLHDESSNLQSPALPVGVPDEGDPLEPVVAVEGFQLPSGEILDARLVAHLLDDVVAAHEGLAER